MTLNLYEVQPEPRRGDYTVPVRQHLDARRLPEYDTPWAVPIEPKAWEDRLLAFVRRHVPRLVPLGPIPVYGPKPALHRGETVLPPDVAPKVASHAARNVFIEHINRAGGARLDHHAYLPRRWVRIVEGVAIVIASAVVGAVIALSFI